MEKEYEVRPYQPGDEEEIVRLLDLVFGGWPQFNICCSATDHWRWKYRDNPLKRNQATVGLSNGIIIGCSHSFPVKVKIGNKVYLGTHGGDVAVRPDFRGIAVWGKTRALSIRMRKESGVQLHYFSTGNPVISNSLSKKTYHRFPHTVRRLFRTNDFDLHLRKRPVQYAPIYKYGFHLIKMANRCGNALRRLDAPTYDDFHINKITRFDERINTFWEEIRDQHNFILERSRDYLNWRYCDPRGGDYLVRIAEANEKMLGYIVLRINSQQKDYSRGYIVDLLTLPSRLDVANVLVKDAVSYFDANNINIIMSMAIKNHPYEAILKKNGFIADVKKCLLFYMEYEEVEDLRKLERDSPNGVHFAYGDFDGI